MAKKKGLTTTETEFVDDKLLVKCEIQYAKHCGNAVESLTGMGEALANAHEHLAGIGRQGRFGAWIAQRCGELSKTQAYRLMKAYHLFGRCRVSGHFSHRAIEFLSSDKVPEDVTSEAIALALKGKAITEPICKAIAKSQVVSPEVPTTSESEPHVDTSLGDDEDDDSDPSEWVEEAAEEEPEEEVTTEELLAEHNRTIESFCRSVRKLANTKPDVEWLDHKGRWDGYFRKVCQGLDTLRSAKGVICPKCEGDGCEECLRLGYLPKIEAEAIA